MLPSLYDPLRSSGLALFEPAAGTRVVETRDTTLLRFTRRAMATTFEIDIPYGTPDALAAAEDAFDVIDELEDQMTVYRDSSEVSQLNRDAVDRAVPVEPGLFGLLNQAAAITRETAGAFDLAIGRLIKVWGFFRRAGAVPPPVELRAARQASGMRHVILDAASTSVKFRVPALELNLGAIGKGYALDRAAERLKQWGIRSALLHAGGSSVLALGTPPGLPRGWLVAIRDPLDESRTLGTVHLTNRALGTSAATYQFFEHRGKKLGHLLDPRTGWPASGTACATVAAPTAAEADAYSTALFVLGPTAAREFCCSRPHLDAVLL